MENTDSHEFVNADAMLKGGLNLAGVDAPHR